MTINITKIKKQTTATVANSAISRLTFDAVRSNDFIAWTSDGITTRNDIFDTSTRGSATLYLSWIPDCRFILFDVTTGWSSPQFTWAWETNNVIWDNGEKIFQIDRLKKENKDKTYKMAIMMINATNDSNVHNHFISTLHSLEHDRLETESISKWGLKYGRSRTYWSHLRINAAIWIDKCGRIQDFAIRANSL